MGYDTRYRFDRVEDMPRFSAAIEMISDYSLPGSLGEWSESVTWYEHDDHIAKAMRTTGIKRVDLHGEGEENGDVWDKIYLLHDGGLVTVHTYKYRLVRPDFATSEIHLKEES